MQKRILVVEDNDLNRKLFCDVLVASGFAVEPVADGNRAIEAARSFFPNLVVMDIQLQDVSGLDLIAILKRDSVLAATTQSLLSGSTDEPALSSRPGDLAATARRHQGWRERAVMSHLREGSRRRRRRRWSRTRR